MSIPVALDGAPLLGRRTGIGTYTANLLAALAERESLQVTAFAVTLRGGARPPDLPARARWRHLRMPARGARAWWSRFDRPALDLLGGRCEVAHGTNFYLPPPGRAAGVLTIHDLAYLHFPELVHPATLAYREQVPQSLRRAAVVLTPTGAVRDEVLDAYRVEPERVLVSPLGVDPSWTAEQADDPQLRARLGIGADYLLAAGTLEPRKGIRDLLAAYRQLRAARPDCPQLVLAGPVGWGDELGPDGPPAGVVLTGYLSGAELRALMGGAALFVFPSRYEGFGLPPLEALAAGTPVVASDLPTSREVLAEHARYFPVGSVQDLTAEVAAALADPPDAARRDRDRAYAAEWTWDRCADATVAGYRLAMRAA